MPSLAGGYRKRKGLFRRKGSFDDDDVSVGSAHENKCASLTARRGMSRDDSDHGLASKSRLPTSDRNRLQSMDDSDLSVKKKGLRKWFKAKHTRFPSGSGDEIPSRPLRRYSFGGTAARRRNKSFDSADNLSADGLGKGYLTSVTPAESNLAECAPVKLESRTVSFDGSTDYTSHNRTRNVETTAVSIQNDGQRARINTTRRNGTSRRKFRVKPYHCFPESVNMTEEELYNDSLQPTKEFEFLSSYLMPSSPKIPKSLEYPLSVTSSWGSPRDDGRIGALRVEVLGCISLGRQKPDVCVYAVCGDSAFCTDVIPGYRSPMFPSASKRAVVIPLHHAYAQLFIGVFDVRVRKNKENDVFIGRVAIDIASLRPETEYDITFPLRASTFVYDRRKRGVVRLRFSLHWFSERAAIMSYFSKAVSRAENCPLVGGQPTIPCGDPKTFRNVAITAHGQDLPGKYTRGAFRATMREFNLYQQNLIHSLKIFFMDAVMYEKPLISVYLFLAGMHCILANSVQWVPPYVIGYILILFIDNYMFYVSQQDFNLGYKPLTISELVSAILLNSKGGKTFGPILVKKRTKNRKRFEHATNRLLKRLNSVDGETDNQQGDVVPSDHREFPFSEMDTYPKLEVESALAPSKSNKGGVSRFHGRLSVYYTTEAPSHLTSTGSGDDDDSSVESEDNDDETVMSESQMMGDDMFDLDMEGEDEDDDIQMEISGSAAAAASTYGYGDDETATKKMEVKKQRIKVGPPQDSDVKGRKTAPQVHLKRIENRMHKLSMNVSVEMVEPAMKSSKEETPKVAGEGMTAEEALKKKKKTQLDEFDKLLGLQSRSANPVVRIMSSFLGPMMRIIRIMIFLMRIAMHVSTWRDPYLSFWVLIFLGCFLLFLLVFPWRIFFFFATLITVGPQNIFLKKIAAKKSSEKAEKKEETTVTGPPIAPQAQSKLESRQGIFRRAKRRSSNAANEAPPEFQSTRERPAFRSEFHGQAASKKMVQPRSVAIPYSCLKKDRFYDWPPDPTVSRATPLSMFDGQGNSLPGDIIIPERLESAPSTVRRRENRNQTLAQSSHGE